MAQCHAIPLPMYMCELLHNVTKSAFSHIQSLLIELSSTDMLFKRFH